jgi:hypothetical protein
VVACLAVFALFVFYVAFIAPRRELIPNIPVALGSNKTLIGAKYAYIWDAQKIITSGLAKV